LLQQGSAFSRGRFDVEPFGTAILTEEIPAQRAVTATVPRQEITGALKDPDAEPELVLQIAASGEDEPSTIAMTWSRDDLEQLLERVSASRINLTFDRAELSQAVGDVDAHGLRERALVFAVAATGAVGTGATIANAMSTPDVGSATGTSLVSPASAADSLLTDASSAGGYTAPAAVGSATDSLMTDASSGGGYSAPAAVGSATDSLLTDASSAGGYTAPAAVGSATDSLMTDASTGGGYGPAFETGSSGEILGIHQPSTTDELLIGGVLLAIAGATFAGRRTGGTARPA
jgi:hypothetical protein